LEDARDLSVRKKKFLEKNIPRIPYYHRSLDMEYVPTKLSA
jgi:hypothetical protein